MISHAQLDKNLMSRSSDLLFLEDAMNPKRSLLVVMANEKIYPFLADENLDFRRLEPFTIPYWQDHTRFLGGYSLQDIVVFMFSDHAQKGFASVIVNLTDKSVKKNFTDLRKNEVYVESFALGPAFYIITTNWNKSTLNFYEVSTGKNFDYHQIDLADVKLRKPSLFEILFERSDNKKDPDFLKVSRQTINSLATGSHRNKIYYFDSHCKVTLDYDGWRTTMLSVNLQTWQLTVDRFGLLDSKNTVRSNSFICEQELYRSVLTKDSLIVSIYDLDTKIEKKKFSVGESDDIKFKNGPVAQAASAANPKSKPEVIESTKEFFQKIASSQISIAVNKFINKDTTLVLTIGSYRHVDATRQVWTPNGTMTVVTGSITDRSQTSNPIEFGFKNYDWSRSTFFQSKISTNFEYLSGTISANPFDKLKSYLADDILVVSNTRILTKDILFRSSFKSNGKFYEALYDKNQEKLIIFEP